MRALETMRHTLLLLLALAVTAESRADTVALRVGKAITVSGDEIDGATIVIVDGTIRAIGRDVEIPRDARVIDRPSGVAMPGIVDVHTTTGLRLPNENLADVPYVSVLDGIDPSSPGLENSLRHGVTTVHCAPSNSTRFGGQGAVIRTKGRLVEQLVVKAPASLKLSLEPAAGENRMGNMAALRRQFLELWQKARAIQDRKEGRAPTVPAPVDPKDPLARFVEPAPDWSAIDWDKAPVEEFDERDQPLVRLVRGELRAFVYVPQAADIYRALEVIETNGLRATLVLGGDAWRLVDVLKGREGLGPVVLDESFEVWEENDETGEETRRIVPRLFQEAGIPFTVQVRRDGAFNRGPFFSRRGEYHHWYQAARLVRYGMSRQEALKTITLTPAQVLGLDHRLGSLEVGKDGNIAVFTGDPLDARSWTDLVLIEGDVAYSREDDPDLQRLLRAKERPF